MAIINLGPFGTYKLEPCSKNAEEPQPETLTSSTISCPENEISSSPASPESPPPSPSQFSSIVMVERRASTSSGSTLAEFEYPSFATEMEELNCILGLEFKMPAQMSTSNYFRRPSQTRMAATAKKQFERQMIEIIAVTFDVNFDTLNSAIYGRKMDSGTNTILTAKEQENLIGLSQLVRRMELEMQSENVGSILLRDFHKLWIYLLLSDISRSHVSFGRKDLELLVVDFIGWYSSSTRPVVWEQTVPGSRRQWKWPVRYFSAFSPCEKVLEGCKRIIKRISPNLAVAKILFNAFESRRKRCGARSITSSFSDVSVDWRYPKVWYLKEPKVALTKRTFQRDGKRYMIKPYTWSDVET